MRGVGLGIIAALFWSGGALAAGTDESVQRAMKIGATMLQYDRAAWVTSDDLMTKLPAERRSEVGGWIVTPSRKGYRVDYIGKAGLADHIAYSANVDGRSVSNAIIYPQDNLPVLQAGALTMARALTTARLEMAKHPEWRSCAAAPFNTIVLPPDAKGTVAVYFLTPQTSNQGVPFGGHYQVAITKDGQVSLAREFARSCIVLPKPNGATGNQPQALFLTHMLDAQPTEIHVFQQFSVGVPLVVGTDPDTNWVVADGRIERVER